MLIYMKAVRACKLVLFCFILLAGCSSQDKKKEGPISPEITTSSVEEDADDCAIWIHPLQRNLSLIIGNDKGKNGALYLWDLSGKEVFKTAPLKEPQNMDIRYGITIGKEKVDLVACPIAGINALKVFKVDPQKRTLVDITTLGGIPTGLLGKPYGFSLYKQKSTGRLYAFISEKKEAANIIQLLLEDDGKGKVKGSVVTSFGQESIRGIVEGMCVDDDLGFLYAADEKFGIVKFFADPTVENKFIHTFAEEDGIQGDREGIDLYLCPEGKGYLVLSSQGNSTLKIYERENENKFITTIEKKGSSDTDGIAVTSCAIPPKFPYGFVVCHNDRKKNFVIYNWEDVARDQLSKCFCQNRE